MAVMNRLVSLHLVWQQDDVLSKAVLANWGTEAMCACCGRIDRPSGLITNSDTPLLQL
jgi:hypothetical protein